jgi:ADP-heptose:LPS heptosyltransferase
MFACIEELEYGKQQQDRLGLFVIAFFINHGPYSQWVADLPVQQIYQVLKKIHQATGYKIVLSGAKWDRPSENSVYAGLLSYAKQESGDFLVDLSGQTTLEQFFGLLRSSSGCVGFCGGNTIMSVVFKKPTVILWNKYFNESFWRNSCPPDSLNHWYLPVSTATETDVIIDKFMQLAKRETS